MIRSLPNVIFGWIWHSIYSRKVVGICSEAGLDQAIEMIKESNSIITPGESSDICSITQ